MENIVDLKNYHNKKALFNQINELSDYLHQQAQDGVAIHDVEQGIWDTLLKIGEQALGQFIASQGDGDMGDKIKLLTGKEVKRLAVTQSRIYRSIFGYYTIERVVYGSREGQKVEFVPLDSRLQLPKTRFSNLLADWNQQLAVENPFNQVNRVLTKILKLKQPLDSIERITYQGATLVDDFRQNLPKIMPEEEHEIIVHTADGKGIPIVQKVSEKPIENHKPRKGPKPDKKKMAVVGSVYSSAPNKRSPEAVIASLFQETDPSCEQKENSTEKKPRIEPLNKRLRASLTRTENGQQINATEEIFNWLVRESEQRNPQNIKPTVIIMDGQPSLWTAAERLPERRVEILDLLHATPRIWDVASLFYDTHKEKLVFIKKRILRILQGEIKGVIRGIKQMGGKRKLSKEKIKKLTIICNYLNKNQQRMQYHHYLEKGYPIASGVIEGACKHFIKDRMERAGMRWTIKGAQAMLDIRSVYLNKQWDEFTAFRIKKEMENLYLNHQLIQQFDWKLVA